MGDVLLLPIESDSVDIVFSNGVLHHSKNWRMGVSELLRVLKQGGFGWLYLIEDPGGLFWDVMEILRVITRGESPAFGRAAAVRLLRTRTRKRSSGHASSNRGTTFVRYVYPPPLSAIRPSIRIRRPP